MSKFIDLVAYVAIDDFDGTYSRVPIEFADEEYAKVLEFVDSFQGNTNIELLQANLPDIYQKIWGQVNRQLTDSLRADGGFFAKDEENLMAGDKYKIGFYWPTALDAATMWSYYRAYQYY